MTTACGVDFAGATERIVDVALLADAREKTSTRAGNFFGPAVRDTYGDEWLGQLSTEMAVTALAAARLSPQDSTAAAVASVSQVAGRALLVEVEAASRLVWSLAGFVADAHGMERVEVLRNLLDGARMTETESDEHA